MTDKELIEQTRARLESGGKDFGDFWKIVRYPRSSTSVWFWGKPKGSPNYSCQFDEEAGELLWCNT